jgi:hypothetical protein
MQQQQTVCIVLENVGTDREMIVAVCADPAAAREAARKRYTFLLDNHTDSYAVPTGTCLTIAQYPV